MKHRIYFILVPIILILILIIDYSLSFYGKGNKFFDNKITYGYNTDFDPLEGFKIEEEDFIQVIGYGTKINNNIVVNQITKYSYDPNGIYCEIKDKNKQIYLIKVVYNKNGEIGKKIQYQLISKLLINKDLNWYNVYDSKLLKISSLCSIVLKVLLFLVVLRLIIDLFRKKY